ncbi:hypothetical protein ACWCPQ_29540 [Nocardia sp. NPDC001965]
MSIDPTSDLFRKIRDLLSHRIHSVSSEIAHPIRDIARTTRAGVSEPVSADADLVREIRTRAGLSPETEYPDIRRLRSNEMRQTDDIRAGYFQLGRRPHETEPATFEASQLRTEPAEDLDALISQARTAEGGARLVIGGGHEFRPAEPGEVFVNVNPDSRPDAIADFRNLSIFDDSVFDRIYLEKVPLADELSENGASELGRVIRGGGQLLIATGISSITPGTERNINVRALRAAGFGEVNFTVVRDDLLDPDEMSTLGDWYEISAIKTVTSSSDGVRIDSKRSSINLPNQPNSA